MKSVELGDKFPDFTIDGADTQALRSGRPLIVAFWKASCPTCRLTLPFLDRIQDAYPMAKVLGVCQDGEGQMRECVDSLGIRFSQVSDADLAITRSFAIDVVPTTFLTGPSGVVLASCRSWDQSMIEAISREIARMLKVAAVRIVREDDGVPAFKPG